jgi:pyruvate,water dikinase
VTTKAAAFPVVWDDPADAEKTWHYNPEHMPLPLSPLAFELALAPFLRGFGWGMNPKQVNYYTYFAFDGPRDGTEPQTADVAYLKMAAQRWHEEILPEVLGYIELYRTPDFDALSDEELVSEIERLQEVRFRSGQLHTQSVHPYWVGHRLLIDTYKQMIADDELGALRLAQGYTNKSVEQADRLWSVTRIAASIPTVRDRLLAAEADTLCDVYVELESSAEAAPFVEGFRAFLDEFGWRTASDFSAATWLEDPAVPLTMLRTFLEMPDYDRAAEHRQLVEEREAAIAATMAQLDADKQTLLQEVLDAVRGITMLSEDHNYYIDQRLATTPRRLLLAAGRRLVSEGTLADPELVFFLRTPELIDALRNRTASLQEVATGRTEELRRWRNIRPPPFVGTAPAGPEAAALSAPSMPAGDAPNEFRGLAASAGVARGPVRVLTQLSQAGRLRPGDVLVVPVTSPPWTPLFAIACAIVTEVGGSLSHTAVVAREYAIPAVVNVRDATKLLRDGQLVEVDGSGGIVHVLG